MRVYPPIPQFLPHEFLIINPLRSQPTQHTACQQQLPVPFQYLAEPGSRTSVAIMTGPFIMTQFLSEMMFLTIAYSLILHAFEKSRRLFSSGFTAPMCSRSWSAFLKLIPSSGRVCRLSYMLYIDIP